MSENLANTKAFPASIKKPKKSQTIVFPHIISDNFLVITTDRRILNWVHHI